MANGNFPTLPDANFVDTDPQQIIDDIIAAYEEVSGQTLAEADPRRLFLLSIAYIIIQQRQMINASGRSNLLYYAEGDYLDHLGLFRHVERIEAQPAVDTERFTLSSVRPNNVGIPQGTRVTADNQLYWQTTQPATIIAGNLSVDVPIAAMIPGTVGNGVAIGEIDRLVDPIPFVQTVSNIDGSSGGVNRESDESYSERIYQAPVGFSIAGPRDAYIFLALSASATIANVTATSPNPGEVEVVPLLDGGQIPNQSILDLVEAALSPNTVRPLTDSVIVSAPTGASYDIDFTYFIRTEDSSSESDIQARVNDAVEGYRDWQHARLGRDINPDELISRVVQAGAKRLVVTSPVFTTLAENQVAQLDQQTVNYGGTEDD